MVAIITFHFHRHTSLFAKLIRWRTGSDINHSSIEFDGVFYDANAGRRLRASSKPDVGIVESIQFWVSGAEEIAISGFLKDTVGAKYDNRAIINFILNKMDQKEKRWFCSEHGYEVFKILVNDRYTPRKLVSPEMLRWACRYYRLGIESKGI